MSNNDAQTKVCSANADDQITIPKSMFEQFAKCQLTEWIRKSLEYSDEDNDYPPHGTWIAIRQLYELLLKIFDAGELQKDIKTSIFEIYNNEYPKVKRNFETNGEFYDYLRGNKVLSDLTFLRDCENFMELLSESHSDIIGDWVQDIDLHKEYNQALQYENEHGQGHWQLHNCYG